MTHRMPGNHQCTHVLTYYTLKPRQYGRHFADNVFKCIFLNENVWILVTISLQCVSKVSINNIPALVQIMTWRRSGDKPLSEPIMVSLLMHICVTRPQWVKTWWLIYASVNLGHYCFCDKPLPEPLMDLNENKYQWIFKQCCTFLFQKFRENDNLQYSCRRFKSACMFILYTLLQHKFHHPEKQCITQGAYFFINVFTANRTKPLSKTHSVDNFHQHDLLI